MLGLRFCARAFSSCGERGPLFIAVRGPLTIAASLVAGHRLQTRRLSNCGSRAQLLRGMWDPPSPGLKPASPALAGRLPTTAPPGKPGHIVFCINVWKAFADTQILSNIWSTLKSYTKSMYNMYVCIYIHIHTHTHTHTSMYNLCQIFSTGILNTIHGVFYFSKLKKYVIIKPIYVYIF